MNRYLGFIVCLDLRLAAFLRRRRAVASGGEARLLFEMLPGPDGRERTLFRMMGATESAEPTPEPEPVPEPESEPVLLPPAASTPSPRRPGRERPAEPARKRVQTASPRLKGRGRRIAAVGLTLPLIALIAALGAIAYFTTSGTGSGSASVGTINAPTNVVATADNASTTLGPAPITITWDPPVSGATPSGYEVVRDNGSTHTTLDCTASPCVDAAATDDTYTYKVRSLLGTSWTSDYADSNSIQVVNDNIPPYVVSIDRADSDPTNAASVDWTVTFSESVSGVDTSDFTLAPTGVSGALISGVSGSGATWTVTATTGTGDGTLGLDLVDDDTITDGASNELGTSGGPGNGAFTGQVYTIDKTAPVASIDLQAGSDTGVSNSDDLTNAASLVFDVSFAEAVSGPGAGDFSNVGTATGCVVGAPAGSGPYTVTLTGCSEGSVVLRLLAAAVTDAAGNANAQTDGSSVTIDRTAPVATIVLQGGSDTGASSSDNITKATSLVLDLSFTESVTGLSAGNFSKGAGTATGCSFGSLTGSGSAYTITASGCSEGTLTVRLAASAASDAAGNQNVQTDGSSVTIDRTAPTTTSTLSPVANGAGWNNSQSVNVTLTTGSGTDTITYSATGATPILSTTYVAPFPITAEGTTTVAFHAVDVAGNLESPDKTEAVKIDLTNPTGSITAPTAVANVSGVSVAVNSNSADGGSGVASALFERSPIGAATWTTIGAADTTSPYGVTWNTTAVVDGQYDLRVTTTDNAGRTFTSALVTVRVDNTAPTNALSLNLTSGGAFLSGANLYYKSDAAGSFTLTNALTDTGGSGPASSTFPAIATGNMAHTNQTVSTPSGGPFVSSAYTWTSPATFASTHAITGTDNAGNTNAGTTLTFVTDIAAGAPTISFPTATTYTSAAWTASGGGCSASTICGAASDGAGSGVNKIELSIRQGSGNYWNGSSFSSASQVFNLASGTTSWSLPFSVANFSAGGSYTVAARMTDNVGNVSTTTSVTFTIDTPPVLTTLQFFDTNANGKIDQIKATFNETLATPYSAGTGVWTLTGAPAGVSISSVSVSGAVATLTLAEGSGFDTAASGMTLALAANATGIRDAAGNQSSVAATAVADKAGPVPVGISDTDGTTDGLMEAGDSIAVTFSESIAAVVGPGTVAVETNTPGGSPNLLSITGFTPGSRASATRTT